MKKESSRKKTQDHCTALGEICKARHLSGLGQITLSCCSVTSTLKYSQSSVFLICRPLQSVSPGSELANSHTGVEKDLVNGAQPWCTWELLGL